MCVCVYLSHLISLSFCSDINSYINTQVFFKVFND